MSMELNETLKKLVKMEDFGKPTTATSKYLLVNTAEWLSWQEALFEPKDTFFESR